MVLEDLLYDTAPLSMAQTPEKDTLPDRFLSTPLLNDTAASLTREQLQELVAEYHRQRGR